MNFETVLRGRLDRLEISGGLVRISAVYLRVICCLGVVIASRTSCHEPLRKHCQYIRQDNMAGYSARGNRIATVQ